MLDFETNYKINPPFREKKDNEALVKGLTDGTIDAIVSSHSPQDEESKKLEFDLADFGIISQQTVLPCMVQLAKQVDFKILLEKVTAKPREILGLPVPTIEEGEKANITLFDLKKEWIFNTDKNCSKSENSPFLNQKLKGKVVGVFHNGKHHLNPSID